MRFTDKAIKALKSADERYDMREGSRTGFAIRIFPSGLKSWIFFYNHDGRKRRMTLGNYPELSLADARTKLNEARAKLMQGIDPADEVLTVKQERIAAPTIADLVDEFLLRHVSVKAARSLPEYRRNLLKDIIPTWGKRKAKDISKRDVLTLLESIVDRGAPNQANQLFKIIRRMFNFAVERDVIEHTPCAGVKLPSREVHKDRFLNEKEIFAFWQGLETARMTEATKGVLRLILLTGQRPGEVTGMHRSEIEGEWWSLPGERSKNGRAHRIPLTVPVLKIIESRPVDGFLFPSPRGEKPIDVNALAHAVRRCQFFGLEPWTPHDLRRTAASHMASLGFGVVVDKVLNHTDQRVTAIYDRYSYDREKRQALESWARKLESIITGEPAGKILMFKK